MNVLIKKSVSFLLSIIIAFSFASVAYAANASGQYGVLKYEIVDSEVVITGCDSSASGEIEVPVIIDDYIVTKIGDEAFAECFDVTAVTVPDTVYYIGYKAFYRTAITEFVIPEGITVIKNRTFDLCTELERVVLPESLEEIEYNAFNGCSKLAAIDIPESVTKIGSAAFQSTALTSVIVPEGVTSLVGVFDSCKSLTEVNLPDSLVEIGRSCFYSCSALTSIELPANLQSIGYSAFYHCVNLAAIEIPDSVSFIDEFAFFECSSLAGNLILPDGITEIKPYSFYNTAFTDVYIPVSVTVIADNAFGQCEKLNVYYPGSPEEWKAISISETNTRLFSATINYYYGTEVKNSGVLNYINFKMEIEIVSCDSSAAGEIIIPSEIDGKPVTVIGENAFKDCSDITAITIPSSVKTIREYAFSRTGITEITIPESVTELNDGVLCYCSKLTEVNLPNTLKRIGRSAFAHCRKIVEFDIPKTVTEIEAYAFSDMDGLKSITIPEGVSELNETFSSSDNLTEISLPESLVILGNNVFYYCYALEKINLPQNLTQIGVSAFEGCKKLTSVIIPENVKKIGARAFYNCTALADDMVLPEGITEITGSSFYACSFENVVIPASLTIVSTDAFSECANLKNVYFCGTEDEWNSLTIKDGNEHLISATVYYNYGKIGGNCGENLVWSYNKETKTLSVQGSGDMVNYSSFDEYPWYAFKDDIEFVEFGNSTMSVGSNAFNGCANLKEVYLGKTVEKIEENAFADCSSLAIVTLYALNFVAEENSFSGNDNRFVLLHNSANLQAAEYAQNSGIDAIPIAFDYNNNVMNIRGELTVYDDLDYNFLAKFIKQYPKMQYLFFSKLVFDGVLSETIEIDDLGNVAEDEEYIAFTNIYISLKAVKGDSEESITFAQLVEMLESGNHEGFLIEIESDDGKESIDFMRTWDHFVTSALKAVSKLINAIAKLFRR